jgi:hypothetical protein
MHSSATVVSPVTVRPAFRAVSISPLHSIANFRSRSPRRSERFGSHASHKVNSRTLRRENLEDRDGRNRVYIEMNKHMESKPLAKMLPDAHAYRHRNRVSPWKSPTR